MKKISFLFSYDFLAETNKKEKKAMESALLKAAAIFSTKRRLAKQIGVSPERINSWLNKDIAMPVPYAFQIQRATKFQVRWYELVSNEDKERMEHANTPLEKEMGYFIELSDVHISKIKVDSYTVANKEKFSINLEKPICIDEDNNLIFGLETITACKKQGNNKVPTRRLSLFHLLKGHYGKRLTNIFSIMERVQIGIALEKYLGERRGRRNVHKSAHFNVSKGTKTRELVATHLGFGSHFTYQQIKNVFQQGCSNLIDALDQENLSISKAARLAKLTHEEQLKALNINF